MAPVSGSSQQRRSVDSVRECILMGQAADVKSDAAIGGVELESPRGEQSKCGIESNMIDMGIRSPHFIRERPLQEPD